MKTIQRIKNKNRPLYVTVLVISILLAVAAALSLPLLLNGESGDAEEGILLFTPCVALIPALWIDLYLAGIFSFVAEDKGYHDALYLNVCVFLPPAGYLLVCALPNKKAAATTVPAVEADDLPEI